MLVGGGEPLECFSILNRMRCFFPKIYPVAVNVPYVARVFLLMTLHATVKALA